LNYQLLERGSEPFDYANTLVAQDFFVIEFDDFEFAIFLAGLQIKTDRVVVHIRSLAEGNETIFQQKS